MIAMSANFRGHSTPLGMKPLLLIDVAGLTVENAAREMGVKPGTVKSRRSRARDAVFKAVSERDTTAV
ncbi:RNA polymerase sigma factor [Corynebacterium lipophiloflavum]|nr:sigma-70 region 4 domain-containing protein [Corynebacterium lipophiloflavum]